MVRVEIPENSVDGVTLALTEAEAVALLRTKLVSAMPQTGGIWRVTPIKNQVGAVRFGDHDLVVKPKAKFSSLLFMLAYARDQGFQPQEFDGAAADDDLWPTIAETAARLTERALERGVLHGYVTKDDQLPVVRGRIRISDQLSRHRGLPLPLEVRYSEYAINTPENRILRSAIRRLLGVPKLSITIGRRLRHLDHQLSAAELITPGAAIPVWIPTKLNQHYRPALHLAEIILAGLGLATTAGDQPMASFVVNMAKVFEDFVGIALSEALSTISPGRTVAQYQIPLDVDQRISVKPDVVHLIKRVETAVYDAKYKLGSESGKFPPGDLYQMHAYCTIMGLPHGHLIYAGTRDEISGITKVAIRNAAVTIQIHPLDVAQPPSHLLTQMHQIATASLKEVRSLG